MSEISDQAPCEDWWATSIIEMRPGMIRYRGYAIEDLIGRISFPAMIWLMLRGELPSETKAPAGSLRSVLGADHFHTIELGPLDREAGVRLAREIAPQLNDARAGEL